MTTGIAGVLAFAALALSSAPAARAADPAEPAPIFTALPPAPSEPVTDRAQMLSPEARARLAKKLEALRSEAALVRLYVYTLRNAGGASPPAAAQELYRRWRMRDRELGDGLATIFVFWDEKKALVMLGQGAPERTEEALAGISADLEAVFGADPEGALARTIDRIAASFVGDTDSWIGSPPVPAEPSGPLHGNPDFADDGDTRMLEEAVRRASTPEHPITLVLNPAKGVDSLEQRAAKLAAAWPDRILLVASRSDFRAAVAVPATLADRFPEVQTTRIREEIQKAMTSAAYPRTLARAVAELAMLAEGRTPEPWIAWKHPLLVLGGGQDETPAPLAAGLAIGLVLLAMVGWFLYLLVTNPRAVLVWIGLNALDLVIGGLFSGGGSGGSGGGFSGGGGSFGGGGASGSW